MGLSYREIEEARGGRGLGQKEKGDTVARSGWKLVNERKSQDTEMNTAQAAMGVRQREEIGFGGKEADTGSK